MSYFVSRMLWRIVTVIPALYCEPLRPIDRDCNTFCNTIEVWTKNASPISRGLFRMSATRSDFEHIALFSSKIALFVVLAGLEPATSPMWTARSNQLNYKTELLQNSSVYCVILKSHCPLLPIRPFRAFLFGFLRFQGSKCPLRPIFPWSFFLIATPTDCKQDRFAGFWRKILWMRFLQCAT